MTPNNSFKPSPLRGLCRAPQDCHSAVAAQRSGLTQALDVPIASEQLAVLLFIAAPLAQDGRDITLEERGAIVSASAARSLTAADFYVQGSFEEIKRTLEGGSCARQTVHTPGMKATPLRVSVPGIFTYRFTRFSGSNSDGSFWVALFDDQNPYRVPTGITLSRHSNDQVKISYFPHNSSRSSEIHTAIQNGSYFCAWTTLQALPGRHININ